MPGHTVTKFQKTKRKPPHHLVTSLSPPSANSCVATRPHLCHLPLETTPRRPGGLTDEDHLVASNRAEHVVEGVVGQLEDTGAVNALERPALAIVVPIGGVSASSLRETRTRGRHLHEEVALGTGIGADGRDDVVPVVVQVGYQPGLVSRPSPLQMLPCFSLSPSDRTSLGGKGTHTAASGVDGHVVASTREVIVVAHVHVSDGTRLDGDALSGRLGDRRSGDEGGGHGQEERGELHFR